MTPSAPVPPRPPVPVQLWGLQPVPPGGPAPAQARLPGLPERPRRAWLWPILTVLMVVSALLSVAGGAATAVAARHSSAQVNTLFVNQMSAEGQHGALQGLLDRRAAAVRDRNKAAFLADVDPVDAAFVRKQELEYDNLTRLPLSEFSYRLEDLVQYNALVPSGVRERYHGVVRAAAVDVLYSITGVDEHPVAAPWVPVFGLVGTGYRVVAEVADRSLPLGTNGQAWDAAAITVARSARVVAVLSADDAGRADALLRMSEAALDQVAKVRKGAWAGKIFVTAVQDSRLFEGYFADSPDRISQVAAVAVPYYGQVPTWNRSASFAATRVVFNPHELGTDDVELAHVLAHEFTHAALGPVTTRNTPLWLVEGTAEYVSYKGHLPSDALLRRLLAGVKTPSGLPSNSTFYSGVSNYLLGWLACRMIAEQYGEAKLQELYEAFQRTASSSAGISQTLGVDEATLTTQWQAYVEKARTSSVP